MKISRKEMCFQKLDTTLPCFWQNICNGKSDRLVSGGDTSLTSEVIRERRVIMTMSTQVKTNNNLKFT